MLTFQSSDSLHVPLPHHQLRITSSTSRRDLVIIRQSTNESREYVL